MSKVTEYKVRKAIEAGADIDAHKLAVETARPQDEVRRALVKLYPDQFGTPGVDVPYHTKATLDELVEYAQPIYDRDGVDAILAWEFWPAACCCMGPQRGEPLCPCGMRSQLYMNKAEVAAKFIELANEDSE